MPRCKNPECRDGQVPGIVIVGRGSAINPVLGQKMTWSWVDCPLCNPNPKLGPYKPVRRTEQEIAARADLATRRAPYSPVKPERSLGAVHERTPNAAPPPARGPDVPAPADSAITGLTQALNRLLAENADLRAENLALKQEIESLRSPGLTVENTAASQAPS